MSKTIDPVLECDINLLLLASILDDADARHIAAGEPTYDQTNWRHPCGTPACAIGHWNFHRTGRADPSDSDLERYRIEFGLDDEQWAYLFGFRPGYAKSATEEANRIRAFVSDRASARR